MARGHPVSTRLSGYALPGGKWDKSCGTMEKIDVRELPAKQLRVLSLVWPEISHER